MPFKNKEDAKRWREQNPEKAREKSRNDYKARAEKAKEYTKKWRIKNADKQKAHRACQWAIKAGKLTRPSNCSICNSTFKIEAHHEDYSKPLEVKWVCSKCHHNIDNENYNSISQRQ